MNSLYMEDIMVAIESVRSRIKTETDMNKKTQLSLDLIALYRCLYFEVLNNKVA